jgi:hypothetical protein
MKQQQMLGQVRTKSLTNFLLFAGLLRDLPLVWTAAAAAGLDVRAGFDKEWYLPPCHHLVHILSTTLEAIRLPPRLLRRTLQVSCS